MGYSAVRVNDLLNSPAMEELVAQYRLKVDEAFVENVDSFFEVATRNMMAAERHISDHIAELDETGELLPVRVALAISRDAADRFGYGKKQTNINVDFASALEKAIARSGKGTVIEGPPSGRPNPPVAVSPPPPRVVERAVPRPTAPPPLLRRRA